MPSRRAPAPPPAATALLLALVATAAAGCGAVRAGGQYSGVPDTTVGDWRFPLGTLSTDGRIQLHRETGWSR